MSALMKERPPTRLSLSCIECRSRKVKCNRGNPCESCIIRGSVCQKEVLRKPNRKRNRMYKEAYVVKLQGRNIITTNLSPSSGRTEIADQAIESTNIIGGSNGATRSSSPGLNMTQQSDLSAYAAPTLTHSVQQHALPPTAAKRSILHPDLQDVQSGSQNINEIFFSSELLSKLFGFVDERIYMDVVEEGINSGPSSALPNYATSSLSATPVRHTMCISRFNDEAGRLSVRILEEYSKLLPQPNEMSSILATLKTKTASTRCDLNTVLDTDAFAKTLCQHAGTLSQLNPSSTGMLPASEVFYVVCALFYAKSVDKSSNVARDIYLPFVIKLSKQLTGLSPSLILLQACRMWSMGCMQCDLVEEAASAIVTGSRAAISMGIHKYEVMMKQPVHQRPFLIDALVNLLCDGCIMRAVFGIETPIDPASLDASLFVSAEDMAADEREDRVAEHPSARSHKVMPMILRLHPSTWIFIERYYHREGRLRVPTDQSLKTNPPIDEAEDFETNQLDALNKILRHCALELERPLASWLSAPSRHGKSRDKQQQEHRFVDRDGAAQSTRALQLLYLIRYYRILINFPFIRIQQDSRVAVIEAAQSTINTTWRLARHSATCFQDNLALYGCICLRVISFLAACRSYQPLSIRSNEEDEISGGKDQSRIGADNDEQIQVDFELSLDALEKIDRMLKGSSSSLASLASAHLNSISEQ